MKKLSREYWGIAFTTLLFIITVVIGICAIYRCLDESIKYEQEIRGYVGSQVAIQGDTLLVVSYSLLKGTYTLSNGVEVSQEIVYDNILR